MLRFDACFTLLVFTVLAFHAAGCGSGPCELSLTCFPSEAPPDAASCDPRTHPSPLADACGIFASTGMGDDANPGTKAAPVQTLTRAIELANATTARRVYACMETFIEEVRVPAGMTVQGAFDCQHEWQYRGAPKRSLIYAGAGQIPLVLRAEGGPANPPETRIMDVEVRSFNGKAPGESSIAVLVEPDVSAMIDTFVIFAGTGQRGTDGTSGDPDKSVAQRGTPGRLGWTYCGNDPNPGGEQVTTECGAVDSIGGKGGDGTQFYGHDGEPGKPDWMVLGHGGPGKGGDVSLPCTEGQPGADGMDGAPGKGAEAAGSIGLGGYTGAWGQDGTMGLTAQGGGGGGGDAVRMEACQTGGYGGPSGGSGGSGGCGGKPGHGGGPGGASIGIIDLSGRLSLANGEVGTREGGPGGAGGQYQLGGDGAPGGWGGKGVGEDRGCGGGDGGKGGDGGHGGGGLGGAAVGIAFAQSPPKLNNVTFSVGLPGSGGGGDASAPITLGSNGLSGDLVNMPLFE